MRFVLGFIQKLPPGPMIIWSQLIQSTGPLQKITQLKKKKMANSNTGSSSGGLTYKGFFFLWLDDINLLSNNSVPRDDFWKRTGPFSITDGMSYALHWGLKKKSCGGGRELSPGTKAKNHLGWRGSGSLVCFELGSNLMLFLDELVELNTWCFKC